MATSSADAARQLSAVSARPPRFAAMVTLALGFVALSGFWVQQAELRTIACNVTSAVPAVPALAALLLLMGINPLLRRTRVVRPLSAAEILTVYVTMTLGVSMYGIGGMRFLLMALSVPYYLSSPADPISNLTEFIPAWLSPKSALAHRWLWEGSPAGMVPWGVWGLPALAWTGFFLLLGGVILCLLLLVAERWMDQERLAYPLARLPLEIIGAGTIGAFFRNPLTWVGMGIATALNAIWMARAVFSSGSSYGGGYFNPATLNLGGVWTGLTHMPVLLLAVQPGLIGLAYLVSNEVSVSIIIFFVLEKLVTMGLIGAGLRQWEIPFAREQAIGGYVVMGLVLLWMTRDGIAAGLRGWTEPAESAARPHFRWALLGAAVCLAGTLLFLSAAGMALWLAALYIGILVIVSLTYARVRAEVGVPLLWARPYYGEYNIVWHALGGARILGSGPTLGSATIFNLTYFISRTGFTSSSGYEIEGIKLWRQMGLAWGQIVSSMLMAIAVGVLSGLFFHLSAYYEKGAIVLPGGHWGDWEMAPVYARTLRNLQSPERVETGRLFAAGAGGLMVLLITAARARFTGLPLHPLGYLVANLEYASWLFPTFLIVVPIKALLLRYGGSNAYVRAMPAFLGLALGHFISGGVVWGTLSAALGGPFLRWAVWTN